MKTLGSPVVAALPASTVAGPVFLLSLAGAKAYSVLPRPLPFDLESFALGGLMLVPATIFGLLISFAPNAIGTYVLSKAGEAGETARAPIVWIGIGAASGFGFAVLIGVFEYSAPGTFALVATSAICAGPCRTRTRWEH